MKELRGARALVLGLGRSGRSAAAFLAARGARVVAADERPAGALEGVDATRAHAELVTGRAFPDPAEFDLVVPSPGVPAERWAGAPRAWGDVELAARALAVPLVAITGTNGKTTTALLVERMLCAAGLRAEAAGNIGRPALELVGRALDVAVLEVSSFQLEAVESLRPRVAVVLNVAPDHLDRHGTLERYAEAKARLVAQQRGDDVAVGNAADPLAAGIAAQSGGRTWLFHAAAPVETGAWWDAGAAVLRVEGETLRIPVHTEASLAADAVLAALLACRALGADPVKAARGLLGFAPPPHRRELVAERDGVTWVNDSKATNPAAAVHALEALTGPAVWIAGGRAKGTALGPLADTAARRARAAVLIGEAADALDAALGGRIETRRAGSLEQAVAAAGALARPGDTVLLSPACASFDWFRSYEERGERFRRAVHEHLGGGAS